MPTVLVKDLNIILSGFMGSGKSVVGSALAARLGLPFIDMDRVLEDRLGMPVARVFAMRGEAFFREQESLLALELAAETGQVIATGGGTLIAEGNYSAFAASGVIFNLNCDPAELLRRLADNEERPLLQGDNRLTRIEALLQQRQAIYARANFQLDTTSLAIDQVVEEIVDLCRAQGYCADIFSVEHPLGSYDIWFGHGLLQRAGDFLQRSGVRGTLAIVTNPTVRTLHGDTLAGSLAAAGYSTHTIEIPDGEEHKTLRTVEYLYDRFLDLGMDRGCTVIACGGGVIGDIAGFAAATFMRGMPLVQVPTTLLAQVDSSIGGKVGIDHPYGKNLVGAFHAPQLVIADPELIATLPASQVRNGLAEIVKSGVIRDPELFAHLEQNSGDIANNEVGLDYAARAAIAVKVGIVTEDPFERGLRTILNFGHTFGHAVETSSGYTVPHGVAVSLGMVTAARLAAILCLCPPEVPARISVLLRHLGLPTSYGQAHPDAIFAAMSSDKKKRQGRLRYVLPVKIGEVVVTDEVPEEAVRAALNEVFLAP